MEQFRRGELLFDVIDAGPADGPVVVLLHGFPEQNTMWLFPTAPSTGVVPQAPAWGIHPVRIGEVQGAACTRTG
jgi:pimeloyl-ACP methyl ester carboxylesterase